MTIMSGDRFDVDAGLLTIAISHLERLANVLSVCPDPSWMLFGLDLSLDYGGSIRQCRSRGRHEGPVEGEQ